MRLTFLQFVRSLCIQFLSDSLIWRFEFNPIVSLSKMELHFEGRALVMQRFTTSRWPSVVIYLSLVDHTVVDH